MYQIFYFFAGLCMYTQTKEPQPSEGKQIMLCLILDYTHPAASILLALLAGRQ